MSPLTDPYENARQGVIDLGPLTDNIGYLVRRLQLEIFQHFNETLSELDIRTSQFSVLSVIANNPGLSQRKIAAALGIKRPNFVTMFDTLEQRGLAVRRQSPSDGRSHALYLTDKGEAFMKKVNERVGEHEDYWRMRLGEADYCKLMDILQSMLPPNEPR
ncbi:MAG: MarR family transcriptional regulator [Fimbriimonadaceae bacterium]|nr:MarR family transcriptional regulator [Alphaproteobacteria bacterium]